MAIPGKSDSRTPAEPALSTEDLLRSFQTRCHDPDWPSEEQIRSTLVMRGTDDELDCGACGYASCRDRAVAVHRNTAEPGTCSAPMMMRADPRDMEEIFTTFVSNAIRYSIEGGEVTIRGRQDGARILVTVEDTGIGISPGNIDLPCTGLADGVGQRYRAEPCDREGSGERESGQHSGRERAQERHCVPGRAAYTPG